MASVVGFGGRRDSRHAPNSPEQAETSHLGQLLTLGIAPKLRIRSEPERGPSKPSSDHPLIAASDIEELSPIAIYEPAHILLERVETIMRRGVSAEEVFVDLLAPVARWMGEQWEEDRLDFVDVSMGLWRLQEVLREIAAGTARVATRGRTRSVLLAPMPGDQHGLGSAMVQECFSLAGWDTTMMPAPTGQDLIEAVAERMFDVVGLTLSCDSTSARIGPLIRGLRSVSVNPNLCVLIGGRVPNARPDMAAMVGADGTAATAPAAVAFAERFVAGIRIAATA